ncbi:uncharacterized protein LOC128210229 [Mya arenaria]|uniref:uncharacterized protein LOC128210229 n=1 Tax=Mya arenaria TaxID=6604 RepID=UPI0022E87098|nr:uncharacterized protein LOC128210229 [Mya arenaria]
MKIGLEALKTNLTSADVSVNQRYVTARRARKELRGLHDEMWKMDGRIKARKYRFTKDADTERLLESKIGLGTLDVAGELRWDIPVPDLSTVTWKYEADIDVRTPEDKNTCWIICSAMLSPFVFLLAGYWNKTVKLVDITIRTVTSRLQLPQNNLDVSVLPDDQAAVTLHTIIQLLSTQGQLSCGKTIRVSSLCRGIGYYYERLYVSYLSNRRIEVITLDGDIISTFKKDDGRELFQRPQYVTVSASTPPTLFVSDIDAQTVLREYKDKKLEFPMSVVQVGPGQLLVCGQDSHNVMLLTERDGKMTEIQKDGLSLPHSVSFCPYTLTIVVGMYQNDLLKVLYAN